MTRQLLAAMCAAVVLVAGSQISAHHSFSATYFQVVLVAGSQISAHHSFSATYFQRGRSPSKGRWRGSSTGIRTPSCT